jgi:DNA-binding response OmpR family regulator
MARILVIDDSPDLVMVMRMQLERAGHEVVTAENGRRGLRRFYEERPDLVVLDVRMPELDGWQTLERLRDLSDVPVLMHTGTTPTEEQLARLRPELDGYIHKPAQGPELTTLVGELLVGDVAAQLVEPHRGAGIGWGAPVAARRERAA